MSPATTAPDINTPAVINSCSQVLSTEYAVWTTQKAMTPGVTVFTTYEGTPYTSLVPTCIGGFKGDPTNSACSLWSTMTEIGTSTPTQRVITSTVPVTGGAWETTSTVKQVHTKTVCGQQPGSTPSSPKSTPTTYTTTLTKTEKYTDAMGDIKTHTVVMTTAVVGNTPSNSGSGSEDLIAKASKMTGLSRIHIYIIGGAAAGVLILVVVGIIACICRRKRRRKRQHHDAAETRALIMKATINNY